MVNSKEKILVIKLGALGDFIQAMGPMAAIRKHHPDAHITLLTTKPFESFAQQCGYFDEVWVDRRPKLFDFGGWLSFKKKLNQAHFARVYDLQNNDRTGLYFKLFKPKPEWVGIAKGASHRNTSPERTAGHAYDGHVQTLGRAGITDIEIDPLDWMNEDVSGFDLQKPYILLVPGCAPSRPEKRWPAEHYGAVAQTLTGRGFQIAVLGTVQESDLAKTIQNHCPAAIDLTNKTSLAQIATLARNAAGAIGNDTGPMHLIAATKCPCLVLFSQHSNPVKHAPKGTKVSILQKDELQNLTTEEVLKAFMPKTTQ